jgi:hypothetical protein
LALLLLLYLPLFFTAGMCKDMWAKPWNGFLNAVRSHQLKQNRQEAKGILP